MARALLGLGGAALELRGELLDTTGGVDDALLAGVGGVRIRRHVAEDDEMFDAIDDFLAGGLHRGLGEEALAARDIEVANVVKNWVAFGFHVIKEWVKLTLAGLVAWLDLVDDVDAPFAADNLACGVTLLRGFNRGYDFHKRGENTLRARLCQRKCWRTLLSINKATRPRFASAG